MGFDLKIIVLNTGTLCCYCFTEPWIQKTTYVQKWMFRKYNGRSDVISVHINGDLRSKM